MKGKAYKKISTSECIFCDYYNTKCRKNKKCNHYKKTAKSKAYSKKRKLSACIVVKNELENDGVCEI